MKNRLANKLTWYLVNIAVIGLTNLIPLTVWSKPRSYAEILKSKELRVCYTAWLGDDTLPDYPSPYMEMAVAFAKKKNLQPNVKKIEWSEQFENKDGKILQGQEYTPRHFDTQQCDMYASNISPLDWRKKIMDLNWIYISTMTVVVRKNEKKKYKTENDLKGKTVYVVPNTTYHEWLLNFQEKILPSEKLKIIEDKDGNPFKKLLNGKSDFLISEIQDSLYSKTHISNEIAIVLKLGKPMESGWGFPKGSDQFKSETVKFFDDEKMIPESQVNQIYRRYFGMTLNEYERLQFSIIQ